MTRPISAVAVLVLAFAASSVSAQSVVVTADRVNVRVAPDLGSRVVATLNKGAVLEVVEKAGDWYRVKAVASGVEGYVHRTLVAESGLGTPKRPAPAVPAPSPGLAAPPTPQPPEPAAASPTSKPVGRKSTFGFRGFASFNYTAFTASQTFEAVLGSSKALMYGGGAQVLLPAHLFAQVEAEWFQETGQRVFVFEGQAYPLGIEDKVTLTPIAVSGGYRFATGGRITPYGGGGVSYNQFKEESEFAAEGEDTRTSFIGYQAFGGVEVRLHPWVSVAGEVRYASVPDALKAGAAAEFGENNLGGISGRVRVLVGK